MVNFFITYNLETEHTLEIVSDEEILTSEDEEIEVVEPVVPIKNPKKPKGINQDGSVRKMIIAS